MSHTLWKKTLLVGKTAKAGDPTKRANAAYVTVELRGTERGPVLSICGEIWNSLGTDITIGGQCLGDMSREIRQWIMPRAQFNRLVAIWERWHLNDMRSACAHQRARGETYVTHPSAICADCGYRLGSSWLHEALPADVVAYVESL